MEEEEKVKVMNIWKVERRGGERMRKQGRPFFVCTSVVLEPAVFLTR